MIWFKNFNWLACNIEKNQISEVPEHRKWQLPEKEPTFYWEMLAESNLSLQCLQNLYYLLNTWEIISKMFY